MIKLNSTPLSEGMDFGKNTLYEILDSFPVVFTERQDECEDIVKIQYQFKENQYGYFAHEYRNPCTKKEGSKSVDILAILVDQENKKIYTTIVDVKHNISAFSDNLLIEGALVTAIKNVIKYVDQIQAEILHKNSFLVFIKDEEYNEIERVGIATTNLDSEKFLNVADMLEQLLEEEDDKIQQLVLLKIKNSLTAFRGESNRIREFANKKISIGSKIYDIELFKLELDSDNKYTTSINIVSA